MPKPKLTREYRPARGRQTCGPTSSARREPAEIPDTHLLCGCGAVVRKRIDGTPRAHGYCRYAPPRFHGETQWVAKA